jgi:hypothetical protein
MTGARSQLLSHRVFLFGDVRDNSVNKAKLTSPVSSENPFIPDPYNSTVLSQHAVFRLEPSPMAEISINFKQNPVTILRMQSLKPKTRIRPFHGGEAENGRKLRIEVAPVCQLAERGEIADLIVVSRFRFFEGVMAAGYSR